MPDPYNDLPDKLESAYQGVIRAAVTGIPDDNIFKSFSDSWETIVLPCVVIVCHGGDEDGFGTQNFRLRVSIEVRSSADRQERIDAPMVSLHRENYGRVFDAIEDTALAETLRAFVADFHVFDAIRRSIGPNRIQERAFVSERIHDLVCCSVDL